jgi:hypothetical protein
MEYRLFFWTHSMERGTNLFKSFTPKLQLLKSHSTVHNSTLIVFFLVKNCNLHRTQSCERHNAFTTFGRLGFAAAIASPSGTAGVFNVAYAAASGAAADSWAAVFLFLSSQ